VIIDPSGVFCDDVHLVGNEVDEYVGVWYGSALFLVTAGHLPEHAGRFRSTALMNNAGGLSWFQRAM